MDFDRQALDRYITGNWGEDQFAEEVEGEREAEEEAFLGEGCAVENCGCRFHAYHSDCEVNPVQCDLGEG